MSSLSSSSKIAVKSSLYSHSSSSVPKANFIWRFPPSKFVNLPSCTIKGSSDIQPLNAEEELIQRQELSILIYELGSHLNVSFTCIYTGVVYMHRFFMLHPFQQCLKESVAAACLFLACKVNEMPRPLSEFTRYFYQLLNQMRPTSDNSSSATNVPSEILFNHNQQIIDYENLLLSTLGFCLHVEQPYLTITRTSQMLSLPMEISQKAYEIATKSIFFTLFSMKYTTNLIACFALYLALTSSQINLPDNEDGSQWFHLLNEEFTEKLLKELAEQFHFISTNKSSQKCQQRFEQLRHQKKMPSQQIKPKLNGEQSNCSISPHNVDQQHYPIASTSGSVGSTTSSASSIVPQQQQSNYYEHGPIDIHHDTPHRPLATTVPHVDYSPSTGTFVHSPTAAVLPASTSPKQVSNTLTGQYHSNHSSISSAKPIPTLMTSSNGNAYHNSSGSRYHTRYSLAAFRHPSLSPSQRIFRPPPPPPLPFHPQQFHPQYSSAYVPPASYYPQQQTPLFYHVQQDPSNLTNKRYGEPPAPPIKRFRYNVNTHQQY